MCRVAAVSHSPIAVEQGGYRLTIPLAVAPRSLSLKSLLAALEGLVLC